MTAPDDVSRRRFLGRAVATGAAATGVGASIGSGADAAEAGTPTAEDPRPESEFGPFHGTHQAGITETPSRCSLFVAFDAVADDRAALVDLFRELTDRGRMLTAGGEPPIDGPAAAPSESGLLGPTIPPRQLTLTVGVGASLFDDRYGLTGHKPARLTPMTTFPNDALDPAECHGDLMLQLRADNRDTLLHAIRDITRHTRGGMQPRWQIDGFVNPPRPTGTQRNLLGFKDGIANPDTGDAAEMRKIVWATSRDAAHWAVGGTYQVVRIIRMLVEFWDRVGLNEQERMIGRSKATGAPLDADDEFATPHFDRDPRGQVIRMDAHIRLANPRTPATDRTRILRRGYNYERGLDVNGQLDQGLVFTCFQRDIGGQFEATQTRLVDEPLVDYISPTGGGYFLVLPGVRDERDHLGRGLFA